MLLLSKSLINRPILGLQTGGELATITDIIINPHNLKIEGFYCQERFSKNQLILLTQEIRDIIAQGIVVNDHAALTDPEELVRLTDILEIDFKLADKMVITANKERLGRVIDFAADSSTLYIQKLYVGRSLLKSINNSQLSVDRNSIIEINNSYILIEDIRKTIRSSVATQAA